MKHLSSPFKIFMILIAGMSLSAMYSGEITEKIWTLKTSPAGTTRSLIIHANVKDRHGDLYHVEILERKDGDKPWQFKRLAAHMALTENALRWSIGRPLTKGEVYPEEHKEAYKAWMAEPNAPICRSNVDSCLKD